MATRLPGEQNGMHKLTWKQVKKIRERYAKGGVKPSTLAKEYDVTHTAIYLIVNNKTWKVE